MELIDKEKLYKEILEQERTVEERCSDLLKVEKKNMRKYIQYRATLSAIKSFKCMIDDEPEVKAIPAEQIDDITSKTIAEYLKWRDYRMEFGK